jgi:hypothetical protein
VIVCLMVIPLAGGTFYIMRRKEAAMQRDLNNLLSRYTALEDAPSGLHDSDDLHPVSLN